MDTPDNITISENLDIDINKLQAQVDLALEIKSQEGQKLILIQELAKLQK